MNNLQLFIKVSSAIEPWVIGGLGIFIASNQWLTSRRQTKIAHNKLKYDLFTKRFAVYEAARDYIASIITSGQATDAAFKQYYPILREAKWLLDDDLHHYLNDTVYKKGLALQRNDMALALAKTDEEVALIGKENTELMKWFNAQFEVLNAKCDRYLRITD